jgi:hypothetical protein
MEEERIGSFEEFWPYYLGEHRDERSRRLHFLGTTGFLTSVATSAVLSPIAFPAAMAGFGALFAHALRRGESKGPSFAHMAGMVALPTVASPIVFPAGMVFAYGCAWIGHFKIEKNRPATFKYPLWSLAADFKMWSHMLRGRLWSGDPLEELGLETPDTPASEVHA